MSSDQRQQAAILMKLLGVFFFAFLTLVYLLIYLD
jgi:hypothetical protein